jgi:hypothetical protein
MPPIHFEGDFITLELIYYRGDIMHQVLKELVVVKVENKTFLAEDKEGTIFRIVHPDDGITAYARIVAEAYV